MDVDIQLLLVDRSNIVLNIMLFLATSSTASNLDTFWYYLDERRSLNYRFIKYILFELSIIWDIQTISHQQTSILV